MNLDKMWTMILTKLSTSSHSPHMGMEYKTDSKMYNISLKVDNNSYQHIKSTIIFYLYYYYQNLKKNPNNFVLRNSAYCSCAYTPCYV